MPKPTAARPRPSSVRAAVWLRGVYNRPRTIKERVYLLIRSRAGIGATDKEISEILETPENTTRPRRHELMEDGLIKARSGNQGTKLVWIVT